ncbi:MAG: hypothetical protein R3C15_02030 [Thermoleophilia bacterium]
MASTSQEIALVATPARARRRCERILLLAPACPSRVAKVPDWNVFARRFRTSGFAVWDFWHGAADTPRPEQARPPAAFHLVLIAGKLDDALGGFQLPSNGSPTPIQDGLMRQDRTAGVFFGTFRWGRRTGSLVLAPPYPNAGEQSNRLIFTWRHKGRTYAVGIHGWEPFTETVQTLRRIVAAIPSPGHHLHRAATQPVRPASERWRTATVTTQAPDRRHGIGPTET